MLSQEECYLHFLGAYGGSCQNDLAFRQLRFPFRAVGRKEARISVALSGAANSYSYPDYDSPCCSRATAAQSPVRCPINHWCLRARLRKLAL